MTGLPFSVLDEPLKSGGSLPLLVTLDLSAAPAGVAVSLTAPAATAHSARKCLPGQIAQFAIAWAGEPLSVFAASSQAVAYQFELVP
jgi:hypothetical protein